jgi:5-methylcytosine-specific restriction endonuclease McrA
MEGRNTKEMSKDFSRKFYSSQAWNNCRAAYMNQVNHLCERCLQNGLIVPAEIVHHKIELTPDNITNPDITLNFNNLEAVCRECHSDIHKRREKRFKIMEDGRVVAINK